MDASTIIIQYILSYAGFLLVIQNFLNSSITTFTKANDVNTFSALCAARINTNRNLKKCQQQNVTFTAIHTQCSRSLEWQ